MSFRRLHAEQPESFAFTPENLAWAKEVIARYPEGRQASAVIPLLWRAQEQNGGWVTEPMIRYIADMLGMKPIRVLEIATFYTMFQLKPVGRKAHIQVCGTTPCMLRGAEALIKVCKRRIAEKAHALSADGDFSWEEVECLGACANAPMVQIGEKVYEDLTPERLEEIIDEIAAGREPKSGPQNGRTSSEPLGGPTTLSDPALYEKGSDAAALIEARRKAAKAEAESAGGAGAGGAAAADKAGAEADKAGAGAGAAVAAAASGEQAVAGTSGAAETAGADRGETEAGAAAGAAETPAAGEAADAASGRAEAVEDMAAGGAGKAGADADAGGVADAAGAASAEAGGAESAKAGVADASAGAAGTEGVESRAAEDGVGAGTAGSGGADGGSGAAGAAAAAGGPAGVQRLADLDEAALEQVEERPPVTYETPPEKVDDLKMISGIGPKIERILHDLGIYTFAQIAAWGPEEIKWVDKRLKFKGRIIREKWVEQADALAKGGRDEYVRRFGKEPR